MSAPVSPVVDRPVRSSSSSKADERRARLIAEGATVDDRAYWKRYGDGPNIIIGLHGWSGDHRSFEPIVPLMPAEFTLISFDQAGFGQSPPPDEWSVHTIAEPIAEVIDRLQIDEMMIVGSCSGAIVGMELGLMLGERVRRLVMVDPFMTAPWFFRLFCWGWVGKLCYYSTFANPIGRWLTNRGLADRRTDDTSLTAHFQDADHGRALEYLRALCDPRVHHRGYERLDPIGEFVVGERTFESVKRSVVWWQQIRWPSAPLRILPQAGHMPVHEASEAVAEVVFGPGLPRQERAPS